MYNTHRYVLKVDCHQFWAVIVTFICRKMDSSVAEMWASKVGLCKKTLFSVMDGNFFFLN